MNQTEATERVAKTLSDYEVADSVNIGRAVQGDHPDVMIVAYSDGLILSVTCEILAQP